MTSTQRRARRIAMTEPELDAYLAEERTCRVGTISHDGPHVTPLWFVWLDGAVWLHSLSRSQRWADVLREPRVAITVDSGHDYLQLRGVELRGRAEIVGEVPRAGVPVPELVPVERAFVAKYIGGDQPLFYDGKHAWLRVVPTAIRSWDFRKINGEA